jgi:hypothetical protein
VRDDAVARRGKQIVSAAGRRSHLFDQRTVGSRPSGFTGCAIKVCSRTNDTWPGSPRFPVMAVIQD